MEVVDYVSCKCHSCGRWNCVDPAHASPFTFTIEEVDLVGNGNPGLLAETVTVVGVPFTGCGCLTGGGFCPEHAPIMDPGPPERAPEPWWPVYPYPMYPAPAPALTGWQCPRCGRCYSPFTMQCFFCGPTVITGSGSTV